MARNCAKLRQNAFRTIPDISFFDAEILIRRTFWIENFVFRRFGAVFENLRPNGTSKPASSSNFALDGLFQRSVRPKNLGFGIFVVRAIFFSPAWWKPKPKGN